MNNILNIDHDSLLASKDELNFYLGSLVKIMKECQISEDDANLLMGEFLDDVRQSGVAAAFNTTRTFLLTKNNEI